jgi:hypothetical protein
MKWGCGFCCFVHVTETWQRCGEVTVNPLPLLFKSVLPGQEDCVFFFSGHLNFHAKPETGIPYREKNYNNYTKKTE